MTHGRGDGQPPWEGQQYPPEGYGQQYPPQDQPWQPQQYDPRVHRGRVQGQSQQGYPQQGGQQYPGPTGEPWPPRDPWQQPYSPQQGYAPPPQPQQHRKRSRAPLYAGIAVLVVLAGGGAAYALSGNGGSGSAAGSSPAKPLTCKQQYGNWKTGPAKAPGKQLVADLGKVSSAGNVEDITAMTSALKAAGADAATLEQYPMPACADPGGYWGQMLARVKASGDNAGSASGLGALLLAEAPLKQVPSIEGKMTAELKRTTGS